MVNIFSNSKIKHKAAEMYAEELKAGKLSRREFLARTTALGVTTAAAYTLGGIRRPAVAAGHIQPVSYTHLTLPTILLV